MDISAVDERGGDASVVVPSCKNSKRTRNEWLDLVSTEDKRADFTAAYSGNLEGAVNFLIACRPARPLTTKVTMLARFAPAMALRAICVRSTLTEEILCSREIHGTCSVTVRDYNPRDKSGGRTVSHHQPVNRHLGIFARPTTSQIPVVDCQAEDTV
jgi:hypothetical protein